ncbi:MAG: ABC transporter permease, partial [Acidobacteriota bacterium]
LLGRGFEAEEDRPGAEKVVVLSHGLWRRRFGGAEDVLGRRITLDGEPRTVVGVMPEGFSSPRRETDAWVPLALEITEDLRGAHFVGVMGRLADGVTLEEARSEMDTIAARLEEEHPDTNTGWGVLVLPMREVMVEDVRPALLVLMATVGIVLLIACANVANLLLARMAAREREVAVRSALGAGRWRLLRQLMTESLLLGLGGGALGLALGVWGTKALVALNADDIPRASAVGVDGTVLGFTLGVALATGLVFGLVPALQASRADLQGSLKEGGRGESGGGSARTAHRARTVLILAEVAAAVVLLVGAGLLLRSLVGLQGISPGFEPAGVMTVQVSLPDSKYPDENDRAAFYRALTERVAALPGVEAAGAGFPLPLGGSNFILDFAVEGRPAPEPNQSPSSHMRFVTPGYLRSLGIPLLRGRPLTAADREDAPRVAVINRTMARRWWPDGDPIGERITFDDPTDPEAEWVEIVGIVGDVRHTSLAQEPDAETYLSAYQTPRPTAVVTARTAGEPRLLAGALQEAVRQIDPDLPVYRVRTLEEVVAGSLADQRFNATLLGLFALLALVLASVGVYGVISYSVTRRTHEMGLRMALGAERREVRRMVVLQGMRVVGLGVVLGLGGALAAARFLEGLLFGVGTTDPVTLVTVPAVLLLVALLATVLPAVRATRVDPVVALRGE